MEPRPSAVVPVPVQMQVQYLAQPPNMYTLPPPPVFAVASDSGARDSATQEPLNLDDIFEEFWANDETDTYAGSYMQMHGAGGAAGQQVLPQGAQRQESLDSSQDSDEQFSKKKKRLRDNSRSMTEEQKVERRERNREHAKRSRVRKKFLLESLQQSVNALQDENEKLRKAIRDNLGEQAEELLEKTTDATHSILASNPSDATKLLDDPDYSLVKALQTAQQNFVITDPSMPDNPIVYASGGFLQLTGYSLEQVLGRNCRFLQGPDTDPSAVEKIRTGIARGEDTTVVLLNYRLDGSTFWNQFFVAALRDNEGNIVNYLGVQCKVSDDYAKAFARSEGTDGSKK